MIDELVRAATACNPRSNSFVEACEVAAAMTSNNLQAKLLHRLRRVSREATSCVDSADVRSRRLAERA